MGAIVLDASKVNSYVLPNLTKSKTTMRDAYTIGQSLKNSLPSSFSYKSTVNDIVNQIYNLRKEISDIDSMIEKKVEKAKNIEKKKESRISSISSAVSKLGAVTGGIQGAAIGATVGAAAGGVVGAAAGVVVGAAAGSTIGKAIVNTGAKIVNGAVKVGKTIWNGIKSIGKTIWNGCKKVAKAITSFVKKAVSKLKKAAKAIWEGLKWVGKQIIKTAASIWNVVVSIVKGIVSFVEAVVDAVILIVGGVVGSVVGAIIDLCQGIFEGEWDWSATGAVWKKGLMPIVAADASGFLLDWAYSDAAYAPFQKGGIVCEIAEGVGYYAGMIIATYFTAGAATALTGVSSVGAISVSTISQGAVAAVGSLGKNTQKNYNKAIDSKVKDHYVSELMKANSGLTLEEATAIVEENLANNVYSDVDIIKKNAMNNISGGEITRSVAKAAGTAVIDGGIYFAAGAAGDTIKTYKTALDFGKGIGGADAIGKTATTAINFAAKHKDGIVISIKASKAYISEGYNSLINGDEYDWQAATIDAASTVLAENVLRGFKGSDTLKKGLYSSGGSSGKVVDGPVESALAKLTNGEYVSRYQATEAMAGFKDETSKSAFRTLYENFGKIGTKAVKKGLEKGQEKMIKDSTSGLYDVGVEAVGLA